MSKTIKEALIWASSYLKNNNIENPYFESQLLLKYLLGTTLTKITLNDNVVLCENELSRFENWVEKRSSNFPFAYIVGEKQFMGLDFYVDERVLIPRPDTEILVEWAMGYIEGKQAKLTVCDIGTGSGAIALTIAKLLNFQMFAVDISLDSLEVCARNAESLKVEDKVTLLQGNLLTPLIERGVKVDLVLSNLPYIPKEQYEGLQKEVREHEPYGALIGGDTGLELYEELLNQAKDALEIGGAIAVEIAYHQGMETVRLLEDAGFKNVYILKDLSGHHRVVVGEQFCL